MDKQVVDLIIEDLKELKSDVKLLLADKNQRRGAIWVWSGIFSFIFAVLIALIERN